MKKNSQGFTLIELMIAVAIVGILASIAYPTYQDSVTKSHRSDVKGVLLGLANVMERNFTEFNTYCDLGGAGGENTCGDAGINDTGDPFSGNPPTVSAFYTITISAATASTYTLSAEPIGSQLNEKCGTLTLNSIGGKTNSGGLDQSECW